MKKNLFIVATAFVLCFVNNAAQAQKKIEEGKIRFAMSYPDALNNQDMVALMPSEMNMYFKNGDTYSETKMAVGNMIIIQLAKTGDMYTLMDMMGQKMAMKATREDAKKMAEKTGIKKPEVKITDETKMIAGMKCTKALVTMELKEKKYAYEMWFTKEVDAMNSSTSNIEGIDGFVMEFTMAQEGITIKSLCTSIEQQSVPDSLFKIPAGYEIMNMNDVMDKMGEER